MLPLVLAALAGCMAAAPTKPGSVEAPAVAPAESASAPSSVKEVSTTPMVNTAVIKTERGTFRMVLLDAIAPKTVENFITLTNKGYYQNLLFHRVVPGMLIQGGDPLGTGLGGPGYMIKAEFNDYPYTPGAVGMARTSDPDSAGSQFFVATRDMPMWNGKYTVFGFVYEGLDVVKAVAANDHMLDVKIEPVAREAIPAGILR